MARKIYFAGSIRGGRADAALYNELIARIARTENVLTEHIGDMDISVREQGRAGDGYIYARDTAWLNACDMVIAECTCPSLGVGYELCYAERLGKPCHIFYDRSRTQLSAMLTGDPHFVIHPYTSRDELMRGVEEVLA